MTTAIDATTDDERPYHDLLQNVQDRFIANTASGAPLFTTDTAELYTLFLDALPATERQHYTCSACRRFVNTFGGLVVIDDDGATRSALWHLDDTSVAFQLPITAMHQAIKRATVTGVFYSSLPVWGQPVTGPWHHFAITPPAGRVFKHLTQSAGQVSAEKREDYATLCRALAEFTPEMLRYALVLLKSEALYRSEKVLGVAEWLLALQQRRAKVKGARRDHLTWRAVATAPAGFCHPRSSMIGTLLEDIAAGMAFEEVSKRFASKMHPLQYQRPQAAPSAGNIAQAEKVIAQLKAAGALNRRFARIEDVKALWTPTPATPPAGSGVFGHLRPKAAAPAQQLTPPPTTITWEKFARTVLPTAQQIQLLTPAHGNYAGLVTAVDPAAPPIIQWDSEAQRNPVSWYVYSGGSDASNWNVPAGQYHLVTAIALKPSMWYGDYPHQGKGVIFVLEGARDSRNTSACLFPEILRSELHGVRATIEAYSKSVTIEGADAASACGLMLQSSTTAWDTVARVTSHGIALDYRLDRWD